MALWLMESPSKVEPQGHFHLYLGSDALKTLGFLALPGATAGCEGGHKGRLRATFIPFGWTMVDPMALCCILCWQSLD